MGNTAQMKNGPSLIIHQPSGADGDVTSSSFFRLASYRDSDAATSEARLVTNLSTTTSSKQLSTTPLNSSSSATTTTDYKAPLIVKPVRTDDSGILLYSNSDLQENIGGSVRSKYGKGHIVQVVNNDAYYQVEKGTHNISASNDIKITSGSASDKDSFADIEITATGHIILSAIGDHTITTEGNKKESTHGDNWKEYYGSRGTFVLGESLGIVVGSSTNVSFGLIEAVTMNAELNVKFSARRQYFFGVDKTWNFRGNWSVNIGGKNEKVIGRNSSLVIGMEFKKIDGSSQSIVTGRSSSVIESGFKIVGHSNRKFVFGDDEKRVENSGAHVTGIKWEFATNKFSDANAISYRDKLSSCYNEQIVRQVSQADLAICAAKMIV